MAKKIGIGVIPSMAAIKPQTGKLGVHQPKAGATSVPPLRGQRISSGSKMGQSKQSRISRGAHFRTHTGNRN